MALLSSDWLGPPGPETGPGVHCLTRYKIFLEVNVSRLFGHVKKQGVLTLKRTDSGKS